jgi:hypothetical protein
MSSRAKKKQQKTRRNRGNSNTTLTASGIIPGWVVPGAVVSVNGSSHTVLGVNTNIGGGGGTTTITLSKPLKTFTHSWHTWHTGGISVEDSCIPCSGYLICATNSAATHISYCPRCERLELYLEDTRVVVLSRGARLHKCPQYRRKWENDEALCAVCVKKIAAQKCERRRQRKLKYSNIKKGGQRG